MYSSNSFVTHFNISLFYLNNCEAECSINGNVSQPAWINAEIVLYI